MVLSLSDAAGWGSAADLAAVHSNHLQHVRAAVIWAVHPLCDLCLSCLQLVQDAEGALDLSATFRRTLKLDDDGELAA